jgi:hypothetical protein
VVDSSTWIRRAADSRQGAISGSSALVLMRA